MSKSKSGERVLLVTDNKGEFRVTIPADAKITFGPNVPYVRKGGYPEPVQGYALRIYQGSKENLLAVFCNVASFKDVSLPVERLVMHEAGKKVWKSDEKGFKVEEEVKVEKHFVKDLNAYALLPHEKDEGEF